MTFALAAASLVAFLLGVLPVAHHLVWGIGERKREITGLFDDTAIGLYFDQFNGADSPTLRKTPRESLKKLYDERFGVRTYVLPSIVYVAALVLAIYVVATSASEKLSLGSVGVSISSVAVYSLAGAYLWVVSDLIGRYRQRNLVPSALYFATFRLVIAIPLATALSVSFKDEVAAPFSFLLGAFPTTTLMLIARRTVVQKFGLGDQPEGQPTSELDALQSITRPITEMFSDIGVTTLVQLAYDDPIQLAMRTNLSFRFVLDLVSQALVVIYIDPVIARKFSLRGSVEASSLARKFERGEVDAIVVVGELASELKWSKAVLSEVLYQISEDPHSKFITAIWDPSIR